MQGQCFARCRLLDLPKAVADEHVYISRAARDVYERQFEHLRKLSEQALGLTPEWRGRSQRCKRRSHGAVGLKALH